MDCLNILWLSLSYLYLYYKTIFLFLYFGLKSMNLNKFNRHQISRVFTKFLRFLTVNHWDYQLFLCINLRFHIDALKNKNICGKTGDVFPIYNFRFLIIFLSDFLMFFCANLIQKFINLHEPSLNLRYPSSTEEQGLL
jgi:hypothetical protein